MPNNGLIVSGNLGVGTISPVATTEITRNTPTTSGVFPYLQVDQVADTGQTASTESASVLFDFDAATRTWATGALTTQRFFKIDQPTIAFAAASTVTDTATLGILSCVTGGSNTTIVNTHGILINSGSVSTILNWTIRTAASSNLWIGLSWSPELGIFAAVATLGSAGNKVMTSTNGITWSTRTATFSLQWHSVAWAPSLAIFAAVASTGTPGQQAMTSPDGITWTSRIAGSSNAWRSVTWSPDISLFVAVASAGSSDNQVMSSPDGITWTSRVAASSNSWFGVTWAPSLSIFAAVATTGSAGNKVMTSPDGITWTARTAAQSVQWRAIAWAPSLGIFAAVSQNGTQGQQVMTSPDGITWTSRTAGASSAWQAIAWSPELSVFVALSTSAITNQIMTSSDGITWTSRAASITNQWKNIAWSPQLGIFAAVGSAGSADNQVMTSGSVGTSYGLSVNTQIGADGNYAAQFIGGNVGVGTSAPVATLNVTRSAAAASTSASYFQVDQVADTFITPSTESPTVLFNFDSATRTWATGTLTTQQFFRIDQPTIAFAGASTVTNVATIGIVGAPILGANATVTNTHGLLINAGAVSTATNSYGLSVNAQTGATNNYAAQFIGGNVGIGTSAPIATLQVTRSTAATSGIQPYLQVDQVADTAQTASTESPTVLFNFDAATRTWATGALTTQRYFRIDQPTIAFAGGSTVTDVATLGIVGGPIEGTNATVTNTHGILISAGAVSTADNSYGLSINAQTGATNNYAAQFIGGNVGIGTSAPIATLQVTRSAVATSGVQPYLQVDQVADTAQTASTESPTVLFNFDAATRTWATGALTTQRYFRIDQPTIAFAGGSTVTNVATIGIVGAPILGSNATVTNTHGLLISAGAVSTATNSYGLSVNVQTGATNNYVAQLMGGSVGIGVAAPLGAAAPAYGGALEVSGRWYTDYRQFVPPSFQWFSSLASTWTIRTAASSNNWQNVSWSPELGIFAAVASDGSAGNQVMTSSNGVTWTSRTAASSNAWRGISWAPSLVIFAAIAAVGSAGNQVMTSSDGITWTSRTAASSNGWQNISWSPDLAIFAAVADAGSAGNQVMTSSDGITWTSRTAASSNGWYSVIWSQQLGIFAAVAIAGSAGNKVMTSSDGITWTSRTAASSNGWRDITWSQQLGIFAAVADAGSAGNQVMTSSNGVTWTSRTAASSNAWKGISWSPELGIFAAVANAGSAGNQVMTSSNGITWTVRTAADTSSWLKLEWSPELGIFAAVANTGSAGNQAMTSLFRTTDMPPGAIVQVVSVIKTDSFDSASTSWEDWTGMTKDITPRNISSKFIISISSEVSNSADNSFQYVKIVRNGTDIAIGDASGSVTRCTMDGAWGQSGATDFVNTGKPLTAVYIDSPATSATITYKLQVIRTLNGTATFGRTSSTADANRSAIPSTMIIMEVAG